MTLLRRWGWLGLFALAIVGSGCNIPALSYFIFSPDESTPPSMKKLATEDKDKKVLVAVLATSNLQVSEQLSRVDRELTADVYKHLTKLCKTNKENVEVLPVNVVERYKTSHPDWDHPLDLAQIGKDLKVKYVIYLEINSLSLYKPNSNHQLYQGETDVRVTLVNARKPDDLPETEECHEKYPDTEIDTSDDPNPSSFRSKFLDHVAERIAWKFTGHPPEKEYGAGQ
jgi:TolB-like protein